jgi:Potential Queuosine, Q, salvage protein family
VQGESVYVYAIKFAIYRIQEFDLSITNVITDANGSAARLVNLLSDKFPCFRDETKFEGKTVRFFKRAQIFTADLWAAFGGEGLGHFDDIDRITMFAGRSSSKLIADGLLT